MAVLAGGRSESRILRQKENAVHKKAALLGAAF
jgi:hypothetical protein